jgi:hypothetical protein
MEIRSSRQKRMMVILSDAKGKLKGSQSQRKKMNNSHEVTAYVRDSLKLIMSGLTGMGRPN